MLAGALGLESADALFPWQAKLLCRFLSGEEIPRSLDIPTGLGKTAVMAIWLVARAWGAPLPRRLVYVVDRRAVVDQATAVAEELRSFVERTPTVKERLGLGARALPISTLRGQHVDNREWLEDPAAPAIVVGTVDMVGSRLVFQGYGVTRRMRPYHAGLLGVDALFLLDEAHLVPPFEKLLERISHGAQEFGPESGDQRSLIPPLRLMSLSATGRPSSGEPFRLATADFKHDVAVLRLDAAKRVTLRTLQEDEKLVAALAEAAWELTAGGERPVRCMVFCDRRRDAAMCKKLIDKRAKKEGVSVDTELFVGARRVRERTDAAHKLESLGLLAGGETKRTVPSFLFGTSAGEVGVDLDADCMACDLVSWERMVQRLGRVNRRGEVPGGAEVVVFTTDTVPDKKAQGALDKKAADRTETETNTLAEYEASLARREALKLLPRVDGALDASPGAILRLAEQAAGDPQTGETLNRAMTPALLRPELTRALVEAWAMTSLEEHAGRPDVEPWLRGWRNDDPQARVVWRAHLPVRTMGPEATKEEIEAFFAVAPPHASEVLETEAREILDWLTKRAGALSPRPEDVISWAEDDLERPPLLGDDVAAVTLTRAGDVRRTLRLCDLISSMGRKNVEQWKRELRETLVGGTLVVDARIAGLTEDGLLDVKADAIPRTVDDIGQWMELSQRDGEPGPPTVRFRVRTEEAGPQASADDQWLERGRFVRAMSREGEATRWLVVEGWRHAAPTEESRSVTRPELLEDHARQVEKHARALAKRLRLSRRYADMLIVAARFHDEGKAVPRWQQAFNAPDGQKVYAKTAGPVNHALLGGYRHELGTVLHVVEREHLEGLSVDCRDLALHLIAAHHGWARPFIRISGCDDAPPSVLENHAREIALRHARLEERWGPWGLAWWEALLRAADHRASRESASGGEAGNL